MIVADTLTKRFNNLTAVDRLSFEVRKGEILGFLGPNGAGKSTTMKMLTGYLSPDSGTASIGNFDAHKAPVLARKRLGYLPETGPLYPEMTVEEMLQFAAAMHSLKGAQATQAIQRVLKICALGRVRNQVIETLSKGYRQRVGMAQAIMHDPDYLILDEPTDGLDPNQKREIRQLIRSMAKDKAIILSTHILEEVEAMCDRVIIIHEGRLCVDESLEALRKRHPHYGAVRLHLTNRKEEQLRKELDSLGEFTLTPHKEGWLVREKTPSPLQEKLWELARKHQWQVTKLESAPIDLDTVFASLTQDTPQPKTPE